MQFYHMPELLTRITETSLKIPDVPERAVPASLPSCYHARFTLRGSSLRRLLLNFVKATVPSSDCVRAEAIVGFSEGGDGKYIIVSALQKHCEKRTSLRGGSSGLYHSQPANEHSRKHYWHGTSYESIYLPAGQWASS